jgi:hypothetical protein
MVCEKTDEELRVIAARCEAATPGPWRSYIEGRDHYAGDHFIKAAGECEIYLSGATEADQDFIAAARQDVPRLIAAILASRDVSSGKGMK